MGEGAFAYSFYYHPAIPLVPQTATSSPEDIESTDTSPTNDIVPDAQKIIAELTDTNDGPARLVIPAIRLNSFVQDMGVNNKGEMDVPNGNTSNVGWYKDGTVPGNTGSAVMDAHVFAAFGKLQYLKPGNDIYVITDDQKSLHFKVLERKTYPLSQVPRDLLFNRNDAVRLNLITCAGKLTPDGSTYDHRVIVYAELVSD